MADHAGFGIMEAFDLEKRGRATGDIGGTGLSQHQTFPAQGLNLGQLTLQVFMAGADDVFVGPSVRRPVDLHDRVDELQPFLERPFFCRCIEHQKSDFLPRVGFIVTANDADRALELLAIDPQLAIQRFQGQACREPGRRVITIALVET